MAEEPGLGVGEDEEEVLERGPQLVPSLLANDRFPLDVQDLPVRVEEVFEPGTQFFSLVIDDLHHQPDDPVLFARLFQHRDEDVGEVLFTDHPAEPEPEDISR